MRRLALLIFGVLWPMLVSAAVIEGRVMSDDQPLAGVIVFAHADTDLRGAPLARSEPSSADGLYRLELPPGSYALAGWNPDRTLFAVCGRNPVSLNETTGPLWVGLQMVPAVEPTLAAYDDGYSAAIEGRVFSQGQLVAGAYVSLYLDAAEDFKGQGYRLSLPTGADGYFRFDGLPESDYFLVARHRRDGARVGPVLEGDLFGLFPGNPVTARAGQLLQLELHLVVKLKESAEESLAQPDGPVLRGIITNETGQPLAGLHVFAYTDRVIGHQRPAALSPPTGPDGRFVVSLPRAGTYYVGARQYYGDSPAPGELFGMYEETADHGLTVSAGDPRDNLKIVVEPVAID